MRKSILVAATLGTLVCADGAGAQTTRSVWDGVYTDAQAQRGATLYAQNCSLCHGANLSGTFETPPLMGRFIPYWSGATLDVLMDYTNTAMPLGRIGAVSRTTDADILAFILKTNNFPSGSTELSADANTLKTITFDSFKPKPPPMPAPAPPIPNRRTR